MMENNAPAAAEENQEAAETKVRRGKKNKPRKPLWREILEWVVTLAAAVAIALVIRTFIFEPVRVDGHSMDNTLANGEVMFVTKPEYLFGDPERFDVVICHYPGRGSTNFVKRVVGLPGDVVQVSGGYCTSTGEERRLPHPSPRYESGPIRSGGAVLRPGRQPLQLQRQPPDRPHDRSMIRARYGQSILPLSSWRAMTDIITGGMSGQARACAAALPKIGRQESGGLMRARSGGWLGRRKD